MAGKILAWAKSHADGIFGALRLVGRQALLFPVAVTVLASATFLFGGGCAAWQWWVCVAGAMLWGVWRGGLRRGCAAAGVFAAFLGVVWVLAGVYVTAGWMDTLSYHLPAIRLLIEGWNPVFACTPETLAGTMGCDLWEMRLWHVLAMPKSAWVFDAVAYFFTRAPLNLLFPLYPFLLLTAAVQVWGLAGRRSAWAGVLAIVSVWVLVPPTWSTVDAAVTLGAVGLLAGMGRALGEGRADWVALATHSFWMASAKQVGLFACVLFWLCFAVAWLWRERAAWRRVLGALCGVATALGVTLCLVCASPYFTMWRAYGHPFYPNYTADPIAHPVRDITRDFAEQNADAQAMGRAGAFVNAYVSQTLAQTYYKWKLGKDTFAPRASTWAQGGDNGFESAGPTSHGDRLLFVAGLLAVLLLGGARERLLFAMMALVLAAMPTAVIGYLRYTSWFVPFTCVLLACVAGRIRGAWPRRAALAVFTLLLAPRLAQMGLSRLSIIDCAYAAQATLDQAPPARVYAYYSGGLDPKTVEAGLERARGVTGDSRRTALCNLRLLCRQEPRLRGAEVLAQTDFTPVWETYPTFFCNAEFKVAPGTVWPVRSLFIENSRLPDRKRRLLNYPGIVARVLFVRLLGLVARRLGL